MKMLRYFFHIRKQFHLPYKIIVNGLNYFFFLMLSFSKTVHPILKKFAQLLVQNLFNILVLALLQVTFQP